MLWIDHRASLFGLTSYATAFSSSMLMTVDGVPVLTSQGFANNLVGVERVEILRGPQSALYGKNAEGGVLNIHTRQPQEFGVRASYEF